MSRYTLVASHLLAVLIVFGGYSRAQQQTPSPFTGMYPFGSFDNETVDSINVANLNVLLQITVAHRKGRGLDFNFGLVNNSLFWTPIGNGQGIVQWQPVTLVGTEQLHS